MPEFQCCQLYFKHSCIAKFFAVNDEFEMGDSHHMRPTSHYGTPPRYPEGIINKAMTTESDEPGMPPIGNPNYYHHSPSTNGHGM